MKRAPKAANDSLPGFEHVRRFWHPGRESYVAEVVPGDYYVTASDELIATVLGSCVSACIRDPVIGLGGLNHFMLPGAERPGQWAQTGVDRAHRYGAVAMEHMINDLLKQGGQRERLEAKLVGGGRVLGGVADIGARNIAFAQEYLNREGLRLVGSDLGGVHPRRVFYEVSSGRLHVKKLTGAVTARIARSERSYQRDIDIRSRSGDVELF